MKILSVPGEEDTKFIEPAGVPSAIKAELSVSVPASCIVVFIVGNLRPQPIVDPPGFNIELALIEIKDVPDILLVLANVTFPPTVSKAFTIKLPVYPVVVSERRVFVAAPTVHCPLLVPLNITSSPAAGTPAGDQLPAVAQVDAVVAIQVLVAISQK